MKKIIITLVFFLNVLVTNAIDPVTFSETPCAIKLPSIGWVLEYNFDYQGCLNPSVTFTFYESGNIYGPISVVPSTSQNANFVVIPQALQSHLDKYGCIDLIEYKAICATTTVYTGSIEEVCPCPPVPPVDGDNCIGHFEHKINTENFSPSQSTTWVTFDDNEFPQIFNAIPSLTAHYSCVPFPDPNLPPSYKIKVQDKWTIIDNNIALNNYSYTINSDAQSSLYFMPNLSHNPFSRSFYVGSTIQVCHRKTITESCGAGYLTQSQTPDPPGTLFDCEVCMDVCLNQPEIAGEVIFTNWEPIGDKPAKGKDAIINNNGFNQIVVYPNPTEEFINISFTQKEVTDLVSVSLVDITGKKVLSRDQQAAVGNNLIQLDVSNLATGSYIVRLTDKRGNNFKQKITVQ